jgi:phosphoribosylglycinamide formyltransferase 1
MAGGSDVPRIAVLASGRGSNLQALLDAIDGGCLDARVAGVFSDRPAASALQRATSAGIPALALDPAAYASRADFDAALFAAVDDVAPDLIVCAGFLRLLGTTEVEARRGRMLNIHPSLLPAFKGLRTHRRVIAAGATEHGASVHFVTPELDGGPVLAQARVPVFADDDAEVLAARVLAREHPLLVQATALFLAGRVRLCEDGIHMDGSRLQAPLQLTANNVLA